MIRPDRPDRDREPEHVPDQVRQEEVLEPPCRRRVEVDDAAGRRTRRARRRRRSARPCGPARRRSAGSSAGVVVVRAVVVWRPCSLLPPRLQFALRPSAGGSSPPGPPGCSCSARMYAITRQRSAGFGAARRATAIAAVPPGDDLVDVPDRHVLRAAPSCPTGRTRGCSPCGSAGARGLPSSAERRTSPSPSRPGRCGTTAAAGSRARRSCRCRSRPRRGTRRR